MGIKGLLRFIKPYIEPIHIKKYAGKRVGIDAYSWLYKGAYSCSMELCLNSDGNKKFQYLQYFMHRINLLRHHDITPVVVFDGGNLPCKAATEQERHRTKESNLELAMAKLEEGKVGAASEIFQKAVSITPRIAHQVIQVLKSENIEYIVAPYEADAQLAYLSCKDEEDGGIVAVITEDSDLLAYGCKAVMFKMDRYGKGEEIVLDKMFDSVACTPSFQNFNEELFTGMCVLAGCDFLPSIPGIGIARAYSFVSKYRNIDRVLSMLKFEKGNVMPEHYLESFREAVAVFQHARIYDTDAKKLMHMTPLPESMVQSLNGELDFLGPDIPPSIATTIAEGKLDPITMEAFDYCPIPRPSSSAEPDNPKHFRPLKRHKPIERSTDESSFTILSTHSATETQKTVVKQRHFSGQKDFLTEVFTLSKMVLKAKENGKTDGESERTQEYCPSAIIPDNNPFKKRKLEEIEIHPQPKESSAEQVLNVTVVENTETLLYPSPESQESADSNVKSSVVKDKRKGAKKSKQNSSNCKNGRSILNFFSRT